MYTTKNNNSVEKYVQFLIQALKVGSICLKRWTLMENESKKEGILFQNSFVVVMLNKNDFILNAIHFTLAEHFVILF